MMTTLSEWTGTANPLNGIDMGTDSAPTFADLDGDGDLDLVAGNSGGQLAYCRNTGPVTAPVYAEQTGAANPFGAFDVGSYAAPTFTTDIDGDIDLLPAQTPACLLYLQNTRSQTGPRYPERTGTENSFA